MHQPFGLMVPSTFWHEFGATKSLQLLHIWSPFGVSWYLTTLGAILAARAGRTAAVANIVAVPLAHTAPANKERLDIRTGPVLLVFFMILVLALTANFDFLRKICSFRF